MRRIAKSRLSPRQRQVLSMVRDGKAYKEIAVDLGISMPAVKTYMRLCFLKLNAVSATQAVVEAIKRHDIDLGE